MWLETEKAVVHCIIQCMHQKYLEKTSKSSQLFIVRMSRKLSILTLLKLIKGYIVDNTLFNVDALTLLLHVDPTFGKRFFNTSWAVGWTYWIVYFQFFVFWHMQLYMSWYIISFFGFIFTSWIFFNFSSTPVLTSSLDVVFVLSISNRKCQDYIYVNWEY